MKNILKKKYLIFIIPAILLVVLLIAAAPGAVQFSVTCSCGRSQSRDAISIVPTILTSDTAVCTVANVTGE